MRGENRARCPVVLVVASPLGLFSFVAVSPQPQLHESVALSAVSGRGQILRKRERGDTHVTVGAERLRRGSNGVPALYISRRNLSVYFLQNKEETGETMKKRRKNRKKPEKVRRHGHIRSFCRGQRAGVHDSRARDRANTRRLARRARHDVERVETIRSVPITFVQTRGRHAYIHARIYHIHTAAEITDRRIYTKVYTTTEKRRKRAEGLCGITKTRDIQSAVRIMGNYTGRVYRHVVTKLHSRTHDDGVTQRIRRCKMITRNHRDKQYRDRGNSKQTHTHEYIHTHTHTHIVPSSRRSPCTCLLPGPCYTRRYY